MSAAHGDTPLDLRKRPFKPPGEKIQWLVPDMGGCHASDRIATLGVLGRPTCTIDCTAKYGKVYCHEITRVGELK